MCIRDRYGPVFTGIDEYEVPIIDMFLFLYDQYQQGYVTLDSEMDKNLNELYDTLHAVSYTHLICYRRIRNALHKERRPPCKKTRYSIRKDDT